MQLVNGYEVEIGGQKDLNLFDGEKEWGWE